MVPMQYRQRLVRIHCLLLILVSFEFGLVVFFALNSISHFRKPPPKCEKFGLINFINSPALNGKPPCERTLKVSQMHSNKNSLRPSLRCLLRQSNPLAAFYYAVSFFPLRPAWTPQSIVGLPFDWQWHNVGLAKWLVFGKWLKTARFVGWDI